MNILIVNQPLNNRGDEAAHKSLIRQLNKQFTDANITVLFQSAQQNSIEQMKVDATQNKYVNINTFNKGAFFIRKWGLRLGLIRLSSIHPANHALKKNIREADLVVCAPGGICMGLFQSWKHIYILSLAITYRKKVAYYSRSFGPFPVETKWNRVFKKISYQLLKNFDFISIRDAKTMQLGDEIGISYIPSIDTAFLDSPRVDFPLELTTLINDKDYIVFVPNSLLWHPAYKNSDIDYWEKLYLNILEMLLSKFGNMNILMLPQLFNIGDKGDETYFWKLKNVIKNERIVVISEIYNSDIQQTIISNAKLMIGARYHSIIFAINNEIPFVALSYEHKISGLLQILNLQEYLFDIEKIGMEQPEIKKVVNKIENIIEVANTAPAAKHIAREIAQNCMKRFIEKYS